jgi:diacylglycerol kinase family enzyme
MLSTFLRFEDGSHMDEPQLESFACRAIRIEPLAEAPPGILAADGERLPYGPVQLQVHRGLLARLFCGRIVNEGRNQSFGTAHSRQVCP